MIGIVPLIFRIVKLFTGIWRALLVEPLAVDFPPRIDSLIRSAMIYASVRRTATASWYPIEKLVEQR